MKVELTLLVLTECQYSSLANLVVARGDSDGGFQHFVSKIEAKVKQAYNCVQWNPFPVDFWSGNSLPRTCSLERVKCVTHTLVRITCQENILHSKIYSLTAFEILMYIRLTCLN